MLDSREQLARLADSPEALAHDLSNVLMSVAHDVEHLTLANPSASDSATAERALGNLYHAISLGRALSGAPSDAEVRISLDAAIHAERPLVDAALAGSRSDGLASSKFELLLDLDAGDSMVRCANTMIRRILLNLANNARDASLGPAPRYVIRTRRLDPREYGAEHAGMVALDFVDYGTGIPATQLPMVLQPRFTTKPTGTGLGLAIVQELVHACGGKVRINSREGAGTTVRILLPVDGSDRGGEGMVDRCSIESPAAEEGLGSILLVGSDPAARMLLADELGSAGFRVAFALDASIALRWLNDAGRLATYTDGRRPIDLLITEHSLTDRSGRVLATEVCRLIGSIPVILLTRHGEADSFDTNSFDADRVDAGWVGAVPFDGEGGRQRVAGREPQSIDVLRKPFHPRALVALAARLIRAPH